MVQIIGTPRNPSFGERFSDTLSQSLPDALANLMQRKHAEKKLSEENEALKSQGINVEGIHTPKLREMLLEKKVSSEKALDKLSSNQNVISQLEKDRGLPAGSLSAYVNDPSMAERVTREQKKTQASQPIDPEQLKKIQDVRNSTGFNDLDEVDQYRALTNAGVSKENAEAEAKLTGQKLERGQKSFDTSYKAHEDFIEETTKNHRAFESETKPRLLQMRNIPDEDLISPKSAVFLDKLGIPLGALENPSSEIYDKLSHDLLRGLPEIYGNRILKVEVENFLKTIPSLMNSADGRRMISSNMLKLGEMKEVYYNEMRKQQREAIDSRKPLPKDFQQRVFDQVRPQIDRINSQFAKLIEIKSVPKGTIPFFGPNDEIEFVPKEHAQWASENGGTRIW